MDEKLFIIKHSIINDVQDSAFHQISSKEEVEKIEKLTPEELFQMLEKEGVWVEVIILKPQSLKDKKLIKKINNLTRLIEETNDLTKTNCLLLERKAAFKEIRKKYGLRNYVHYY